MKNNENTQKLIQLIKENPEVRILPMVHQDATSEDYGYTVASIGIPCVDYYFTTEEHLEKNKDYPLTLEKRCFLLESFSNDRAYLLGDDSEEMIEQLIDNSKEDMTETEAEEIVKSLPWEKVIVIYIREY